MKTLHLTNAWSPVSGGIATFYRALLKAANQRGHQMRLVVPGMKDAVEECGPHGRIYYVKARRAPFNHGYRLILPHQYLAPGSTLRRILRGESPDLVEVCDKYTLNWLAGLLRIGAFPMQPKPVVVGLSCERLDENFRLYVGQGAAAEWFCQTYMHRLYFPLFDHHITVSGHTAGELRAAASGHRVERGVWIRPMGVAIEEMSPSRRNPEARRLLLQAIGGDSETVVLLYAGRLAIEKNLPLLIGMMHHLAKDTRCDYRLVCAGSGRMLEELERQASGLGPGRVTFLGHIADRELLANLYANADIFVHPNPREPFGIAPLEAMASGLPVVAPPTGGISEYASAESCWLADAQPKAFASAVRDVQADPALRARRIAAAHETAQRLAWSSVCSAFLDLYRDIHAAAAGRPFSFPPDFVSTTDAHRTSQAKSVL
jgi:alpha-1,6-mannosyltransferase